MECLLTRRRNGGRESSTCSSILSAILVMLVSILSATWSMATSRFSRTREMTSRVSITLQYKRIHLHTDSRKSVHVRKFLTLYYHDVTVIFVMEVSLKSVKGTKKVPSAFYESKKGWVPETGLDKDYLKFLILKDA